MSDSWYYLTDANPVGPLTLFELKKALAAFANRSEIFVWNDALVDWTPVREVPELNRQLPPAPPKEILVVPARQRDIPQSKDRPPLISKNNLSRLIGAGLLVAFIAFGISQNQSKPSVTVATQPTASTTAAPAAPPPASAPKASPCHSDWTKCADNEELINNYDLIPAQVACKRAAEEQAKYGDPVWPWLAFHRFRSGRDYVTSGIVVMGEPDAKFQNVFGTMVKSLVTCTYDLRAKRVVSVDVSPP